MTTIVPLLAKRHMLIIIPGYYKWTEKKSADYEMYHRGNSYIHEIIEKN